MGKKTTTNELITEITADTGQSKSAVSEVIKALSAAVTSNLAQGNSVSITDLGIFKTVERAARTGRNPATGEALEIAASTGASFKAAKALKDALN
jgi:DNA-binding protein HU-beta